MKKVRILLFLLLLAMLLSACAKGSDIEYGVQLIENGSFEQVNGHGLPEAWQVVSYVYDDMITVSDVRDGEAHIVSYGENDSRFVQYIPVEKNTVYHITALIKANTVSGGEYGAGVSVADTFIASRQVFDTQDTWDAVELYVDSRGQTQLGIELRLGFFGNDAMGEAWFRDVSAIAVKSAPQGATVYDYAQIKDNASSQSNQEREAQYSTTLIVCIALLMLLAGLAVLSRMKHEKPQTQRPAAVRIAAAAAAALAIRLLFSFLFYGYGTDISCFSSWSTQVYTYGISSLYSGGLFCDYPPGYMYILGGIGFLADKLALTVGTSAYLVLLKLPACVSDIFAGILIWKIAGCYADERISLALACLYLFNPAVILNSAVWGQIDGILALGVLLAVWLMTQKRMFLASIAFTVTVLMKPQGLMFGPLLLFAFVDTVREERWKGALKLLASFAASAALCILAAVPCTDSNVIVWLMGKYFGTLGSYEYATVNAMNLFAMFGANWKPQSDKLFFMSYQAWGLLFMALTFAYSAFIYFKARDRRMLPLAGAVFLAGVFVLGVRMHERYMFPVLVLLLLACALYGDRRLTRIFVLLSVTQFVNVAMVLDKIHLLQDDYPVTFFFSAANLCVFAYLALTAFEIAKGKIVLKACEKNEAQQKVRLKEASWIPRNPRMTRLDLIAMAGITLAYSILAFINLGDTKAPITTYQSSAAGESVVFDFGEQRDIQKFTYYGGIGSGVFTLEFSDDGVNWLPATIQNGNETVADGVIDYEVNTMFMWHDHPLAGAKARYARIVFLQAGLPIIEMAFFSENGVLPILSAAAFDQNAQRGMDPQLVCDEQSFVPARSSYMNSMYFDEIYHARTAYEHMTGMQWYETTHPPLGKALMSLCVMAFGMTPFAWRLAGTVAGILMLPGIYLVAKLLFRRTDIAIAAALLMALDCMHFAQTRIATIDSFIVLFIIWMYYFMFRYVFLYNFNKMPLGRTLVPLLLSGVMMGLGIASKWTGMYAGMGLSIILFAALIMRWREAKEEGNTRYFRNLVLTLLFCVGVFVVIPFGIYMASYTQYFMIKGGKSLADWWDAQKYMYSYHSTLQATHFFESPWYEWPIMLRPMWFYKGNHDGLISTINTMGNPAVWWPGLAALIGLTARKIRGKDDSLVGSMLLVGFAAQYLPWVLVTRCTFIYHYFTAVPFIILMICYYFDRVSGYEGGMPPARFRLQLGVYLGVVLIVFAFFYPGISGLDMPVWYARLLRWLPIWTIWAF